LLQADARAEELNRHMRSAAVDSKLSFEHFKARGVNPDQANVSSARNQREESLTRSPRMQEADARAEELNRHMRSATADSKFSFDQIKARAVNGMGVNGMGFAQ